MKEITTQDPQPGDRVIVVRATHFAESSALLGSEGKLVGYAAGRGWARVRLDGHSHPTLVHPGNLRRTR